MLKKCFYGHFENFPEQIFYRTLVHSTSQKFIIKLILVFISILQLARPTNKRPAEHLILERRRIEDLREQSIAEAKYNKQCDLKVSFEFIIKAFWAFLGNYSC